MAWVDRGVEPLSEARSLTRHSPRKQRLTAEQLRQFHQVRPFRPFRVHLADGATLNVRRPELLCYPPHARTFAVWTGNAISLVDLSRVTCLEAIRRTRQRSRGSR